MDKFGSSIEDVINAEVEKRVEEKLKQFHANSKIDFYKDQVDMLKSLESSITDLFKHHKEMLYEKMQYYSQPEINPDVDRKDMKCNYPNCDNFNDGTVDHTCSTCDNHKIKEEAKCACNNNNKERKNINNCKCEEKKKDNVKIYSSDSECLNDLINYINKRLFFKI